jgi:hypothetical protein
MSSIAPDGPLMNIVIRMVVPLRREFGRHLNVSQFMQDPTYARNVLAEALGSNDARLRDYAQYVNSRMMGARISAPPTVAAAPAVDSPAAAPEAPSADPTEEELRARVLRKYTTGLR